MLFPSVVPLEEITGERRKIIVAKGMRHECDGAFSWVIPVDEARILAEEAVAVVRPAAAMRRNGEKS